MPVLSPMPRTLTDLCYQPTRTHAPLAALPLGQDLWDFLRTHGAELVVHATTGDPQGAWIEQRLCGRFGDIMTMPAIANMARHMIGQILTYHRSLMTQRAVFKTAARPASC